MTNFVFTLSKSDSDKRSELVKRRKHFHEESVNFDEVNKKQSLGWSIVRSNKNSVRMRLPKNTKETLENRFWCTLYRLGYDDLNIDSSVSIIDPKTDKRISSPVSIFAKDEETSIVACSINTNKNDEARKILSSFDDDKKRISNSIKKHYGENFSPKIIWFAIFEKSSKKLSESDIQNEYNINTITSREILYFEEISKKLGKSAKYQFHAEYLAQQKIPAFENKTVPAARTKVGGKIAYFFSAQAKDIMRISFVNHRDLRDPTGAPSYQRLVKPNRLKQIGEYLDDGGHFPNTILLNFHRKPVFNQKYPSNNNVTFGEIILPDRYKSCWVIDGQHRLFGTTFTKKTYDQPLFFVAFEGISKSDEARTFVTINETQTKVPKNLLTELDGELKWDSSDPREMIAAIASRCVDLLNSMGGSPIEGKVTTPEVSSTTDQPLTLPSFQKAIIQSKLIGSVNSRTKDFIPGPCWELNSERTLLRLLDLLKWHFEKIEEASPARWSTGKAGYLCSNFGVYGHVRLLGELISYAATEEKFSPIEAELDELYPTLGNYLVPVSEFLSQASDEEFSKRFKVPFGSGGDIRYFFKLVELVRKTHPNFSPEGYEDYIQTLSNEAINQADRAVKWIQRVVPLYVIDQLKELYKEAYFDRGVPSEIQKSCQSKRIDAGPDSPLPVETYLEWLNVKKIVEQKDLRKHFSPALSIKLEDEQNGREIYLKWFDKINEIRRIPAHPSGRQYKMDDIDFLRRISNQLSNQLPAEYTEKTNATVS
ncbi:MAG: DGQHR domain-containing protein [Pseudomonadota bacterium]